MRGALLVLFAFSTISTGSVLPFGNYFSGPYAQNIGAVVNLTRQICLDEELESVFPEEEGSGDGERPSSEILKLLFKMNKHHKAVKGKSDLRDRIRDLRAVNIVTQYALDKLTTNVPQAAKDRFSKYLDLQFKLENAVLEFLTLDKNEEEKRLQLVGEHMEPTELHQELEALFSDDGIVKSTLEQNKYSDDTFNLFYRLTKNHAILISVANSIKMTCADPGNYVGILHTSIVKGRYRQFLLMIKEANTWREQNGFKFEELFTSNELQQLEQHVPLPHPTLQNNFLLDMETETLKPKFFYLTIKFCDDTRAVLTGDSAYVHVQKDACMHQVIRTQNRGKQQVFYDQQIIANKFRKAVQEKFDKSLDCFGVCTELDDSTGLMALAVSNNLMQYQDDLNTVRGAYKLIVHAVSNESRRECKQRDYNEEEECEEIPISVPYKVIGYFLYGNQGTDVVRKA